MKIRKRIKITGTGLLAVMLAVLSAMWVAGIPVRAAGGSVYTCAIHPCYAHPVTGQIEDSGGEASYATGQGMVEGVVYTTGILELTDSGEYYLTVRFSLMDHTSGHSFWVQNVGDSGWAAPAVGVTGNGTDGNGTTADICMQVPSENCVVRCSMYVGPMGRDVVFYLYPSDYAAGNNTNMNATMVTASSGSQAASSGGSTTEGAAVSAGGSSGGSAAGNASLSAAGGLSQTGDSANSAENGDTEAPELSSSIEQAADPAASTDTELNDAQGLSLSTAEDVEEADSSGGGGAGHIAVVGGGAGHIAVVAAAVTVSALILMGAASFIVYLFRKNWKRWGGGYDDDEA